MGTPRVYQYDIFFKSEYDAGIYFYSDSDEVTIVVDSGDPGGELSGEGSFQEFMKQALKEWFDGASVELKYS